MGIEQIRGIHARAAEPKERKRYIIPRQSEKKRLQVERDKEILKLDDEFFHEIWKKRKHICINCGYPLGSFNKWFFHHLIPKHSHPELRHNADNVVLLCLMDHSKCETCEDFVPLIKKLRIEAERKLLP